MYEHEKEWKRLDNVGRHTQSEIISIWFPDIAQRLRSQMGEYLLSRNLDPKVAVSCGWYPSWYNGPRIVIPCVRTDPYNFWQGRLIENTEFGNEYKRWDSPKGPRGDAVCLLAGPDGEPTSETLVVVEGPLDALAAKMAGVDSVAVLGMMPPAVAFLHVATIALPYKKILLIGDADSIGGWTKIQTGLGRYGVNGQLKIPVNVKDLAAADTLHREELIFD